MIANGLYAREGASWILKGDQVSSYTGLIKTIEVSYAYTDTTKSSTTAIEAGARVLRTFNRVDTLFNGTAPTLLVEVDGAVSNQTIMATGDSLISKVNTYLVEDVIPIISDTTGPVKLTLTGGSSTTGTGVILVEYTVPFA
jgi:hypothetical protein